MHPHDSMPIRDAAPCPTVCGSAYEMGVQHGQAYKERILASIAQWVDEGGVDFLEAGGRVILLGHEPFDALDLSFKGMSTGRPYGHRGLLLADHPVLRDFPHEGFGDWQFYSMIEGGRAVLFEQDDLPFDPIIEVISAYKRIRKQAGLFELRVGAGRLLVCSFKIDPSDAAAAYLVDRMVHYASGEMFEPRSGICPSVLRRLISETAAAEELRQTDQAADPNIPQLGQ